jgi:predicted metal-dependent hydrolase
MLFLHQTEDKILKILHKQSLNAGNRIPVPLPCDPIALRAMKKQARASLTARTQELALMHGFTTSDGEPLYGRIALKDNRSNWGSCSAKGNINLNIRLHLLPEHLRDYVILHELCHLRHMNHGPEFHKLLESLCPLHLELKKELGKFSIQQ